MLTPFNRIYPITLDINALETEHNTKGVFTNGDRQTSTVVVTFKNGSDPFDITDCTVEALIKTEEGNVYKQDAVILDNNGVIGVDIKQDALILGINEFALKLFKDNGDIIYSPIMYYKVVETMLDGIPIHLREKTKKELQIENELLKREIEELKKQLENK